MEHRYRKPVAERRVHPLEKSCIQKIVEVDWFLAHFPWYAVHLQIAPGEASVKRLVILRHLPCVCPLTFCAAKKPGATLLERSTRREKVCSAN